MTHILSAFDKTLRIRTFYRKYHYNSHLIEDLLNNTDALTQTTVVHLRFWIQCYFEMTNNRGDFKEMFEFKISTWTTVVWVRASVLFNKSLNEMTVIVIFVIKCPNSKCFVERGVNMGHLSHWVIFNLIATGLSSTYNDIGQITLRWLIKRWFQRNVRIQNLKWTTVVWVRASVLFNKSSMRWLL